MVHPQEESTNPVPQPQEAVDPYPPFEQANRGNGGTCTWGILEGYEVIDGTLQNAYDEIIKWRKNCFRIPYGSIGKDLVKEITRLFTLYNSRSQLQGVAIKAVLVILPLILQKPSKKIQNEGPQASSPKKT